ncbi:MAG: Ig-like domain-containing protein, partial [Bacteroidales bacterium]|nr:Ig-like domain-containing protein [Bacteroidales bacterium]
APVPKDAADVAFEWSSADDAVATVSESGLVTAVKAGNTTVKVASGKIEKSVSVTVTADPNVVEIDQVVSYAGIGRAYFEITVSNAAIEKVRIYWNNRQGSQDVPIGGQPSGVYTATVEGLAGGSYEFTLVPVNSAGEESTSAKTTTATVYSAASLAETSSARSVAKVYYYGAANISIYWAPAEATEVKTVVIYTNQQGTQTEREVLPAENLAEINDIQDYGQGFQLKTHILPEAAARDTFITAPTIYDAYVDDPSRHGKLWDDCESTYEWICWGGEIALDESDPREGAACVMNPRAGDGGVLFFQKVFQSFDAEVSLEDGYLAFSLYMDDVAKFGESPNGAFEITSSGHEDDEELQWSIPQLGLASGWNEVELKLSEAGGVPLIDLQRVNFLRFIGDLSSPAVIKIDNIRFYEK